MKDLITKKLLFFFSHTPFFFGFLSTFLSLTLIVAMADSEYSEAEYLDITVTDPTRVNDGSGEFTRYKITTEVCFLFFFFFSLSMFTLTCCF